MQPFRNLAVGEKEHEFTLRVYKISEAFPKTETFGLAATLRRGSAQLTMKIAEACGQESSVDFVGCLRQSRAGAMEVEYQLLLARDLQFMKVDDHDALQADVIEVRKMLPGLMKTASV